VVDVRRRRSAFITILSTSYGIQNSGSILSASLLAVGMSGLRAAYGERAGNFGRSMLLLGMLGPVLWVVVMLSMALMHGSGNLTVTQVEEGLWVLLFIGPAVSLLGLTLFGVLLGTKPMPRLNWLPFAICIRWVTPSSPYTTLPIKGCFQINFFLRLYCC
jgi:hypothetical protein